MADQKQIIVIAQDRKTEALRMASGLTLLDDVVRVFVVGELEEDADTVMQLEALEFAEVPIARISEHDEPSMTELAHAIVQSQAVYVI